MADKAAPPLEKSLERLEAIVEKLESGEVPLEQAIALFEEGRKLGAGCLERLAELERRVELVMEAADGSLKTRPFDADKED